MDLKLLCYTHGMHCFEIVNQDLKLRFYGPDLWTFGSIPPLRSENSSMHLFKMIVAVLGLMLGFLVLRKNPLPESILLEDPAATSFCSFIRLMFSEISLFFASVSSTRLLSSAICPRISTIWLLCIRIILICRNWKDLSRSVVLISFLRREFSWKIFKKSPEFCSVVAADVLHGRAVDDESWPSLGGPVIALKIIANEEGPFREYCILAFSIYFFFKFGAIFSSKCSIDIEVRSRSSCKISRARSCWLVFSTTFKSLTGECVKKIGWFLWEFWKSIVPCYFINYFARDETAHVSVNVLAVGHCEHR